MNNSPDINLIGQFEAGVSTSDWGDASDTAAEPLRLISVFTPAPGLTADSFLNDAFGAERFYWAEPSSQESLILAGRGVAAEVRVAPVLEAIDGPASLPGYRFEEVQDLVRRLFAGAILQSADRDATPVTPVHPARPRLCGGFAFQDDFTPDNTWSVFSPAHFILPHFQFAHAGGVAYLTANALIPAADDPAEHLRGLRDALMTRLAAVAPAPLHLPGRLRLTYPLSFDAWRDMLAAAGAAIAEGQLEKVVLSRVCEARAESAIDAAAALPYLNERYADCYRFLFEPLPHHAFFGATPELLIAKQGDRIATMALAGSAARGRSVVEDDALATQLLHSAKDRHEHQLVVAAIGRQLAGPTDDLSIPAEPMVLRLRNIHHLLTAIEGTLHTPTMGILPLVRLLHPTPAMGGVPVGEALAFLRRAEPAPRGWYAAPIGWLDSHGDGVFAVAIRSAVTQHERAWLYAGAGIVADSAAEREWAETELKFRPMLGALGVENV